MELEAMSNEASAQGAALIINARARGAEGVLDLASRYLAEEGVALGCKTEVQEPSRLRATVRKAIQEGHAPIILGGGDGSVGAAVEALAGRDAALGLLPIGTANDFARTLGIPVDLQEACAVVGRGRVSEVDLGMANNQHYVNVATVGLGAEVARRISPAVKRVAGALAYPAAAIGALVQHQPFAATLTFPDGDYPPASYERLLQVAVGNGRFYGGGMIVSPEADISDGTLDVYALELGPARELAEVALRWRSGEFTDLDAVGHYRTRRVRLETRPELEVNLDGELCERTPALFTLHPRALRVIVPLDSGAVTPGSARP
jgi:YegS/Rv2252/BmrU family lipid kinase